MGLNSSFRFISKIVGTPTVAYEDYYCEIKLAFTLAMCRNFAFYFGEGPICQVQPATSVEEKSDASIPAQFQLLQNCPNPFNAITTVAFDLPHAGKVEVKVFNLNGDEVVTLVNQQRLAAGRHRIHWNAGQLPSGVYVCHIRIEDFEASRKLLLVR